MVSPELKPQACWEFEGEILVLHHPTTISSRYQAMVHCGSIRQTASIINMSKDCLRTGDKAHVKFRFIKHPEYIRIGQRMVFREGRTKAVGNVLKPVTNSVALQHRSKPNKMQGRGQSHGQNNSNAVPQNQNPNVQVAILKNGKQLQPTDIDLNEMKQSFDGVLETCIDKRDMRSSKHQKRSSSHTAIPVSGLSMEGSFSDLQAKPNSSHIAVKK